MSADVSTATIAAKLETVSLESQPQGFKADTGDETFVPLQSQDEPSTPTKEGRRLHLRNIAYATTEGELREFFKDFEVTAVKIPVNPRTTRPLGYAFIDLISAEQATKAITELNNQELAGRVINIDHADGRRNQSRTRGVRTRGRGGRGRGRGGRSSRPGRGSNVNGENSEGGEGDTQTAAADTKDAKLPLGDITNKPGENGEAFKAEPRKNNFRPPKRGIPENGVPSATKIMVANIPFNTTEDKLQEFFAEYEPQAVSIALRPIPSFMIKKLAARQERRMGRGFAFITLSSHEMQEKACKEKNGAEFSGREIAVKVAIDSPDKVENKETAAPTEAPADTPKAENAAPEPAIVAPAA